MAEGMEADEVFPSRNKSIGKRKKKKKSHFSAEMLLECKFTSLIPSLLPTPQIVQHQKKSMRVRSTESSLVAATLLVLFDFSMSLRLRNK